tara:strand:- start:110 stop:676 length:567 start_codon:yes stop_codon:yes gene_type:complete
MIRIALIGDIGSGKTYVANNFGYPVFNADNEVSKLYKTNKKVFKKLKKVLPKHFTSFPINKKNVSSAILANNSNLKKIVKIIHLEVKKKMNSFLKKNINKNIVILDIPLFLENKINKKSDILVFVQSKKSDILKRLQKRDNFDKKILNKFKKLQLPLNYKKSKSNFIIKNKFTKESVKNSIKSILNEI